MKQKITTISGVIICFYTGLALGRVIYAPELVTWATYTQLGLGLFWIGLVSVATFFDLV